MKSAKNENNRNDNTDVEWTNLSVSEQALRLRRQCEKTSPSRDDESSTSILPTNNNLGRTVPHSPSNTEKTEVMLSPSSHTSLPGAVAVAGGRGSEEDETLSPSVSVPSEEIVDVENGGNRNGINDLSSHRVQYEDDTSVVRKQEPVVMETMIHAELVTPPVEALRVAIDEEYDDPSQYRHHSIHNDSESYVEDKHSSSSEGKGIFQRQWGCLHWTIVIFLLLFLICVILLPIAFLHKREDVQTFPYDCYRTTREILEAQVSPQSALTGNLVLIMCPGTRVDVGVYKDEENADLRFVRGDYPLMVVRENVTIQCGLDGKQENSCVLNGGMMQVSTLENVTLPNGTNLAMVDPVDDTTIRGMTFTGEIPLNGASVSLSYPSRNIRFEDCLWTEMTARRGLIRIREDIHRDDAMILGDMETTLVAKALKTIQVTFNSCIFQNIIYDGPLINVVNQKLEVERSTFRNIQVSNNAVKRCVHAYSPAEGELEYFEGCASLLSCSPNGDCSLRSSCVEDMDYKGPGLVVAHDFTMFDYTGLYLDPSSESQCELARIPEFDTSTPNCLKMFEETICQVPSY